MVSGFSGEHSSPLQSYTIEFVGATCCRPLKQCRYPINETIYYTCTYAIYNNWPCNLENFGTNPKNESFGFEFYGGGGDGVGKAGDGYQSAGAGKFGNIIVKAQSGE